MTKKIKLKFFWNFPPFPLKEIYPRIFKFFSAIVKYVKNIINFALEYFIFFRWPMFGYKNHLNNNLRIFSNIFSTAVVCWLGFLGLKILQPALTWQSLLYSNPSRDVASSFALQSVNTNILVLIFAIMGAFFWNNRATYVSKWSYLANLYNDLLKEKDSESREILNVALVQDLVELGFYRHPSFYSVFEETLLESHRHSKDLENNILKSEEEKNCEILELDGKYTKEEAGKLLEKYQKFLLREREKSGKKGEISLLASSYSVLKR